MPPQARPAPYLGSRPFERTEDDRRRFFGRDGEIDELVSLVLSHNLVLVYAASGAGKTSLLNAGVIPSLVEEGFDVLPRARVRVALPPGAALGADTNPYVLGVLCSLSPGAPVDSLLHRALADHLRDLPRRPESAGRVLVVDQAEELFTFTPEGWQLHQRGFVQALRDALRDAPDLRAVIVTREDFLARFDDLAPILPGSLRVRFHLAPLGRDAARQAVEGPLAGTRWTFAPGVADQLVADLSRMKLAVAGGGTREEPGPYVEPVQLQVVCAALWDKLPEGVEIITAEQLLRFGDVNDTLERFYEETLDACVRETHCDKEQLLRWFGRELITPSDTRGQVFRGPHDTEGLPNTAVDFLEARHLIHADERASGRWYELTHDRLVRPIRAVNERWSDAFARARARRRRQARMRWAAGLMLGTVGLVAAFTVLVVMPLMRDKAREYALTTGRIQELRGLRECGSPTPECKAKKERVFDFIADYYWRQGDQAALVRLLTRANDLIPDDYGIPPPPASRRIQRVADPRTPDLDLPEVAYQPAREGEEWLMRDAWEAEAQKLARASGLPVPPRVKVAVDTGLGLSSARVVARPASCTAPVTRTSTFWAVAAPEHHNLIAEPEIKDDVLRRFFQDQHLRGGWQRYERAGAELWFAPRWTLPIWRVGDPPYVPKSREAVIASEVASNLQRHPELVLGCEALKLILAQAAQLAPASVTEAVTARSLEDIRQALIERARRAPRSLRHLPALLDELADRPGEGAAREPRPEPVPQSRAPIVAATAHCDLELPSPALRGAWPAPPAFQPEQAATSWVGKRVAEYLPAPAPSIRIALGPELAATLLDGEAPREDLARALRRVQRDFYAGWGIAPPDLTFSAPGDHDPPPPSGLRIEVLTQDTTCSEAQAMPVPPDQAVARIASELAARYAWHRARWVTPETLASLRANLRPDEQRWFERHFSVTDLKQLARAVAAPSGPAVRGDATTLEELPWLLRSLAFWSRVRDPMDAAQLVGALRDTQRARLRLRPHSAMPRVDDRVAPQLRRGVAALERGHLDDAEHAFVAAIRVDRDAAISGFLELYPALHDPSGELRQRELWQRCRALPSNPRIPDVSLPYEVEQLLAAGAVQVAEPERWHFEICALRALAGRVGWQGEVELRAAALVTSVPPEQWSPDEAVFLVQQWLRSHRENVALPTDTLPMVRTLLAASLSGLPPDAAMALWSDLRDSLRDAAWFPALVAEVYRALPDGTELKGDVAGWLERHFGPQGQG